MLAIIDTALHHYRTMITLLLMILVAGVVTYISIPKESSPDITIPIIYVGVSHQGISPGDAERLLVRPIEQELRSIEGVKEMKSTASEGYASVVLEFNVGMDLDKAMADVRDAVDQAKPRLPADSDEPTVNEVTLAAFQPVLSVVLYGTVPERTTVQLARRLSDRLESYKQILEVDIAGDREDIVEIVVDPLLMESYHLDQNSIYNLIALNNRVVAAGFVDSGYGRFSVKVPSVFESLKDVLEMPVKVDGKQVITFGDIATVRRSFRDPESYARLNGESAVVLDVKKRAGENIIETVELVKQVIEAAQQSTQWPSNLMVEYTWDESEDVKIMLNDLQNNVLSAIILVVIVIIAILGGRTAFLVGISIPGSFLTGLLVIAVLGFTVNIMVLFALIMAVGMLVDGAIVVTEFADRRMHEGMSRLEAYRDAAKRMAWPITASTATTLAAFAPLLFWPDTAGEFMKYLPITLIATLSASLIMALFFVPVLGSLIGKVQHVKPQHRQEMVALHNGDFSKATGLTKLYYHTLAIAVRHPWKILLSAILLAVGVGVAYSKAGLGAEFFPEVDPPSFTIKVRSYGDLSINEKDDIMKEIESVVLDGEEFESVYTKTGGDNDAIGQILVTPVDWQYRRPVKAIIEELEQKTARFAGVEIEFKKPEAGPPSEHDLTIELSAADPAKLNDAAVAVRQWADTYPAFSNLSDTSAKSGIDWQIDIKRDDASRFGADATLVGNTVQFVTNGLKIGDYLPDDANEEVDILVRFPEQQRDIGRFDQLRVKTAAGLVPITNFAEIRPQPKQDTIQRVDGQRVLEINADMKEGYNLALELPKVDAALKELGLEGIEFKLRGQNEDQENSSDFLVKAFLVALGVMALILITQFNSFYQAFLILSAVLFSTVGVFAGLLIFQKPFGIIMSGIGVISLAGIVVNNNIVLIDTYNQLIKRGLDRQEAILRTGVQRLRPVMLTTVTTILGLMPMVLEMNIDLINQKIEFGAPSTQWWSQLATAVAGGLAFATVLTLVLTPCLLMLGRNKSQTSSA